MNPARRLAWIGIGANLGDARSTVEAAIAEIAALGGCRLLRRSSLYLSKPVDADGDDFINAVVQVSTALAPTALLRELQRIERDHGRQRPYRNAPRTLDLDLLMVDDVQLDDSELTLPHPRMHLRAFVLQPLMEIAPEVSIPGRGKAAQWLPAVSDQAIARLDDTN